jgi:hypothetical protein
LAQVIHAGDQWVCLDQAILVVVFQVFHQVLGSILMDHLEFQALSPAALPGIPGEGRVAILT